MTFKKSLFTLLAVAGAIGLSAQEIGGPNPTNKSGWNLGGGFDYSSTNEELMNPGGTNDPLIAWTTGAVYSKGDARINTSRGYLSVGHSLGKRWEMSFRLGLARLNAPEGFENYNGSFTAPTDFEGGNSGFVGFSIRGAFVQGERFSMGIIAQGSYFGNFTQNDQYATDAIVVPTGTITGLGTYTRRVTGFRDGNVALSFEFKAGNNSAIYMGPLYNRTSGRVQITHSVVGTDPTTMVLGTYYAPSVYSHFRVKNNVGGYIGARLPARGDWTANVEAAYRGGLNMGFSFTYNF